MSAIILILILGVLIFVHELGHFLIAKKSGIRVDEFAIGFPPKIFSIKKGETVYSLNAIPVGGYVKIFGESADEDTLNPENKDSMQNKSKLTQSAVLVGGVLFNIIFAYILFVIVLVAGFPTPVTEENQKFINNSDIIITQTFPDSPAFASGIQPGDRIIAIKNNEQIIERQDLTIENIQNLIASSNQSEIKLSINRLGENTEIIVVPQENIVSEKVAIGVSLERVGEMKMPFIEAIKEAFIMLGQMISEIIMGLFNLIKDAFSGNGSMDNMAGPIGIVGLIDNAKNFGFVYLIGFTAFISINLAILNILPIPALDGGRLLIILIEAIIGKRIKSTVVNNINAGGFIALILLMIFITVNDVLKLF